MEYVTGIYALNMPCSLGTPGDWHGACCDWDNVPVRDTTDSIFGEWGIESAATPTGEHVNAANHIRACLDLMEEGFSPMCQGMKNDYFDALVDDAVVFEKVVLLKDNPHWEQIDSFMCKEYMLCWIDFKERYYNPNVAKNKQKGVLAMSEFERKYDMTREENAFLVRRNIVDTIWKQANLEGFNLTYPTTAAILEKATVENADINAVVCVINLKHAWEHVLDTLDEPVNLEYLCTLHAEIARGIALEWGVLRTGDVRIGGCAVYAPQIPDTLKAEEELKQLLDEKNPINRALDVFAWICKSQLFWDGNKRTATLVANKILIENGCGILVVSHNAQEEFGKLLNRYYDHNELAPLQEFLYLSALDGIDFSTHRQNLHEKIIAAKEESNTKAIKDGKERW